MAPDTRGFVGLFGSPRNTLFSKWDTLFDKDAKEWIAFKPALGLHVYPCYSCRHMFYSKKSFQDHINRRAVVLRYKCPGCQNEDLIFYNRCSFQLHCRKHYSLEKGTIHLNNLEISSLPLGLAGFSKHPDIPYLFDVEEEYIEGNTFMNAQFYAPKIEERGREVITLTPSHLVINRTDQHGENQALALKQVTINIPKCQFITLQCLRELRLRMQASDEEVDGQMEVKIEPDESTQQGHQHRRDSARDSALPLQKQGLPTEISITFSEEPCSPPIREPRNDPALELRNTPSTNSTSSPPICQNDTQPNGLTTDRDLEDLMLPVITKVETIDEPLSPLEKRAPSELLQKCPECSLVFEEPLKHHFMGNNRPSSERLRCGSCRLISPTMCSFKAHIRIHDRQPPFVCPDCGENFPIVESLILHMEDVCFHSAKSVRYRCPGRRCGKIFASEATFGPHFKQVHIDTLYQCGSCKEIFTALPACEEHLLSHEEGEKVSIVKFFGCVTCGDDEMTPQQLRKHLDFHCKDLTRCMYIFMCKFCKCYFRSVATMATHLKNCKVQKTGIPRRIRPTTNTNPYMNSKYIATECKVCRNRIISLKSKPTTNCPKCAGRNMHNGKKVTPLSVDKCICVLCKKQINYEQRRQHQKDCKYAKPQVLVEKLDLDGIEQHTTQLNQSFSSSNSDFDGSTEGSLHKHRSDSSDEAARPKKRRRPSKPRKPEVENDLTAEEPILFDGTYQCCHCEYKSTERPPFHEHVKMHRHISTAYQCMECGECFVVKPSLIKHLLHFHNISDNEGYFRENDCFDQSAVTELAKVVKAPYLANSVKENQCKVCMEQFPSAEEHDKHFRIHGMAFLMKNSI